MNDKNPEQINLDILKHVENLSNRLNEVIGSKTKSVFEKYPITFALLVLFGVIAVSEGAKGILESLGIFNGHPWQLLFLGLVILLVTGSVYKKLDK